MTGVALIAFLALALVGNPLMCGTLIIWIFVMRILMILTSLVSYFINEKLSAAKYADAKEFDAEKPLTHLVWITSLISIAVTFVASYVLLPAGARIGRPVVGAVGDHLAAARPPAR